MKKYIGILLLFLLLGGSFFAGSWYSSPRTGGSAGKREPVYADNSPTGISAGTVTVSSEKQQLTGVRVATVEKAPWSHTLRFLGRVVPDENRSYRINAATDGWVKKLLPVTTDSLVKKDELLATYYAPEFFSAMKAYLYGLRSMDRFEKSGKETKEQLELTDANIDNYRNALRNLGMSEHQLDEIMRTRRGGDQVEIRAPAAGFILIRNLSLGERFQRGTELYRIADLSKVWILVDTFETEASSFNPGLPVRVSSPNLRKTFSARVARVPPRFDPATRTLKVRLEADNPGLALRPDMFVDVELPVKLPPAIAVPADAVVDSGRRKTVFVDRGQGHFEPREVETGRRLGDRIEISRGLRPGEKIAVSGTFLIDSESRMELAAAGVSGSLAKDPVSEMDVSIRKAEKAGLKSTYQQKVYYFASAENRARFEQDPSAYVYNHSKVSGGPTGLKK